MPGLSIVVVARESDQNRVLYCKGHGVRSVNGTALVGPDTLFPCASLSKPVSTTLLTAAGVQEAPGWDRVLEQPDGSAPLHQRQLRRPVPRRGAQDPDRRALLEADPGPTADVHPLGSSDSRLIPLRGGHDEF